MPLAIELAAARVRALSLTEILDSLHDRFRLLTGGARTAVRRQQTLRASVDWSHALLTEPERVLFRRLAVFLGGFDLDAAQAVAGGGEVERYQVLDQLTLLVDKSLVVAENTAGERDTGCWRRCASTRWRSSASPARPTPCATATATTTPRMAALLDAPAGSDYERRIEQAEAEIDNLRAAFAWSRENADIELALALASSLQPLWLARGRIQEGLAWFDAALPTRRAPHPRWRRRCARGRSPTRPCSTHWLAATASWIRPNRPWRSHANSTTRHCGPRADRLRRYRLLRRRGGRPYFAEAVDLARALDDRWRLARSSAGRHTRRSSPAIRSRRARPPRKDATRRRARRPVRLALLPLVAGCGTDACGAIWPRPSHSSARWSPRPTRLTTCSCRGLLHRTAWVTRWRTTVTPARPSRGRSGRRNGGGAWRGLPGRRLCALAVADLAAGDVVSGAEPGRRPAATECAARVRVSEYQPHGRGCRWHAAIWSRPDAGPTRPSQR